MEKINKFLANKSIGYFISVGIAFVSLVFGIIYMATFKDAIGNNASGNVPESVGIFMIAGALVQIVFCVLPQYKFISIIAIVLFGLSMYKQIYLVPDFIAGLINNVEYNQGNASMNIFYTVMELLIIITAAVVVFLGVYNNKEDEDADFKNIKGTVNLAKLGGGAAVVLASVLVSTLVVGNLKTATSGQAVDTDTQEKDDKKKEEWNPITDEIKALADSKVPENDPKDAIFAMEETYDFSSDNAEFTALSAGASTRADHYLIYLFEGAYSEGYQGQYNEYYTNLYLWDDGLFTGKSNSQTFKGYWYNDMDGDGKADCLNMVSNSEKYKSIVCSKESGFYDYQAYVYMHPGWGDGRSIIVGGYMVYETIALAIDTTKTGLQFHKGDSFKTSQWKLNRILQNLKFGSVFDMPDGSDAKMKTKWTVPSGLLVNDKFEQTGEFEIKAAWGGLETSVTITVIE